MWFLDEVHSHMDGAANNHNGRFLAAKNVHVLTKKMHHAPTVTLWVAISSHRLTELFF
jgi:hypothetical protein